MPLTVSSTGVPASLINTSARGFGGKGMWIAWSFRRTCHPRPDMASTFPSTSDCRISIAGSMRSTRMHSLMRAGIIRTVIDCCMPLILDSITFQRSSLQTWCRPRGLSAFERSAAPPWTYRWFFLGLEKTLSPPSAFARFSARFSRIVLPVFFDVALLGALPDIFHSFSIFGMTSPYLLIFLKPVSEFHGPGFAVFLAFSPPQLWLGGLVIASVAA